MPDIKAVVFDLDGCLVDSEGHALDVLADELRLAGMGDMTVEALRERFLGISLARITEHVAERACRPCPEDFAHRFETRLFARFRDELRLIEGVPDLLATLEARGIATAIATGSSLRRLRVTLDCVGLGEHFRDTGFSADQVEHGKPAPDLFLLAADRLGIAPSECAVMEDSPLGIAGAVAAGMRPVGFVGGSHLSGIRDTHATRLRDAGAVTIRSNAADLLGALLDGTS
ncbi:HAD family hydrolase [Paracoccus salsus]|uniref:HAD family hydrolase n=1 Tax=Paracoccus salsus TaxID=2911061 RepID=UPI001F1588DB|nr:HAD family phosphatase [Paracoccus salsus]MCF3975053.1 HAD family phosphatase [Paracoccus salsus]